MTRNEARGAADIGAHAPRVRTAEFRFYEELNDFLPKARRKRSFRHAFRGTPSVKDTIEALGVPHTEIDLVLVNGRSVDFRHRLSGGERVAVYPVFERLDISPVTRLRPAPLRQTRFVADVHLGTLARHLRLLGFDCAWRNDLDDETIIRTAGAQRRIILTRDRGILRDGRVTHGYWLRATEPDEQLVEVLRALDLGDRIAPYSRCLQCNGRVAGITRNQAANQVPLQVFLAFGDFRKCEDCHRVYWAGSHKNRLDQIIASARAGCRQARGTEPGN